jgi:hypothetical protein
MSTRSYMLTLPSLARLSHTPHLQSAGDYHLHNLNMCSHTRSFPRLTSQICQLKQVQRTTYTCTLLLPRCMSSSGFRCQCACIRISSVRPKGIGRRERFILSIGAWRRPWRDHRPQWTQNALWPVTDSMSPTVRGPRDACAYHPFHWLQVLL